MERSRHPPSAPQPQELDHTHPLNGFDADVFSNQGHDGLSEGHHSAFFTTTSPHTRNALNTDVFGGHGHEEPFKGQTPGLFTSPSSLARNTFEPDNFGDFRHEELFEVHDPIPVTTPPLPVPNTLGAEAFSNQGHGLPFEEKGPVPSSDCPLPDPTPRDEVTASPEPKRVSHVRNVSENLGARQIVDLALSQPTQVIHRKRYKQKAEFELIQRLNNSHYNQRWYHPATIDTAMRLAGILSLQGRYRSAELLFKQCVDRLEKAFGERNPRTLVASSPLSRVYVQQGQLAKGEKLSRLVYSRASEVFSPSNRDFLSIKIDFAYCIAILGDFTEAERLLREAMTIGGAVLPNDDPILLESTRYLAELLRIRGELDEAEKILLPYVDSRTSNRDNSDHLQTRASLGDEYAEFPKARQPLREVHEAQKQLIGSDHDQSLDTEKDPGLTSRDPGTFVEGEELLRDTINRSAKTLWMKHPLVSDAMQPLTSPKTMSQVSQNNVCGAIADVSVFQTVEKEAILAEFLNQPLRLMEAEKAALKVLTICGDVYCSKDEIICLSAMILGWSHRRQGRLEQALASITTAFEGYMRTRGPDHALTKECERRTIALAQEVDQRKSKNGASPRATDTGQVLRGVLGLTNYDLGLSSNDLVWTANLLALITSDISF